MCLKTPTALKMDTFPGSVDTTGGHDSVMDVVGMICGDYLLVDVVGMILSWILS